MISGTSEAGTPECGVSIKCIAPKTAWTSPQACSENNSIAVLLMEVLSDLRQCIASAIYVATTRFRSYHIDYHFRPENMPGQRTSRYSEWFHRHGEEVDF